MTICSSDELREAELFAAKLEKDGRAKDIRRIWADTFGDRLRRCEIDNAAFGLIERSDMVRIFDPQIDLDEDEDDLEPIDEDPPKPEDCELIVPALVILDRDDTVTGIILDCGLIE